MASFRQAGIDGRGVDASRRVRARGCIADTERARGHQLRSVCLTRSSKPLSLEVFKAALILQRRMRTRRSFSRSARLHGVEPALATGLAYRRKSNTICVSGGRACDERATDPLHRAWVNTIPSCNLAYALGAPRFP